MPLIEAIEISRICKTGDREVVAFVGPSGSGKSTLLNLVPVLSAAENVEFPRAVGAHLAHQEA